MIVQPCPSTRRRVALSTAACAALALAAQAEGAPPAPAPWTIGPADAADASEVAAAMAPRLDHLIIDQPVSDMLAMIERDTGVRIAATEAVRGRVTDLRLDGTVAEALDALARQRDLDWFLFNGTYHVSARDEATVRLVRLGSVPRERVSAALDEAGLDFTRYSTREAANGTALALTGPPRMLAVAEALIESLPSPEAPPPGLAVRIRRGNQLQAAGAEIRPAGTEPAEAELQPPAAPQSPEAPQSAGDGG